MGRAPVWAVQLQESVLPGLVYLMVTFFRVIA
jgi:hypothetical protein